MFHDRRKPSRGGNRGDVCALDLPSLTILPAIVATIRDEKLRYPDYMPVGYLANISRRPDDATYVPVRDPDFNRDEEPGIRVGQPVFHLRGRT